MSEITIGIIFWCLVFWSFNTPDNKKEIEEYYKNLEKHKELENKQ